MSSDSTLAAIFQQLSLEMLTVEDRQQLLFRILNRSAVLCPYHRAVLFDIRRKKAVFLGVSGKAAVDDYSEVVERWEFLVSKLPDKDNPQVLSEGCVPDDAVESWAYLKGLTRELSVYWVPLAPWGETRYGIWFERWQEGSWDEQSRKLLELAKQSYTAAFERIEPRTFLSRIKEKIVGRKALWIAVMGFLLVMFSWRVPLRVVAPCEIVPEEPYLVTAPLNGVIFEIVVDSGDAVTKGDLLVSYDDRVVLEELEIARQQVKILETTIRTTGINALAVPAAKAELEILNYRLKQEKIRLAMAEYRASKLHLKAEVPGTIVVDSPDDWRGRPVEVGEKVMLLVDPKKMFLRIWLPEADNIDFNREGLVKIILNAFPDASLTASLTYVANSVVVSPEGVSSIPAEAAFSGDVSEQDGRLRIGLKGSAVLYGESVSLAYWLLRKPWASVRKHLGY